MNSFTQENTLFFHVSAQVSKDITHCACFDIDWTVACGLQALFPRAAEDVHILPGRILRLKEVLAEPNCGLAFFTNQKARSKKETEQRLARIATFVEKIEVPCCVFVATGKEENDPYRKPATGMWTKFKELFPKVEHAFFVGDALGRPHDFSSSDKDFAIAVDVAHYSPEEFFDAPIEIEPPEEKGMVIMVGCPGSGKSTFCKERLEPLDYNIISKDTFGRSFDKVLKATIADGANIAIDNTNPAQETREKFYEMAEKNDYSVMVVVMLRDGRGWNKLRENPVSDIVYHKYHKNFTLPTPGNTPGPVVIIN